MGAGFLLVQGAVAWSVVSEAMALADEYLAYHRSTAQLWNIYRGDLDEIERWEDFGATAVAERVKRLASFARQADSLAASSNGADAETLEIVAAHARGAATDTPWARDRYLVSAPVGLVSFIYMVPRYGLTTGDDGHRYISKLASFGTFIDQFVDGVRSGAKQGRVATARGVQGSIEGFTRVLALPPHEHPFATQPAPTDLTSGELDTWTTDVANVIGKTVQPAFGRLHDFLRDELLSRGVSDDEPGLCYLPGGREEYDRLLATETSTSRSAEEIHEVGLRHIDDLAHEYRAIAGSNDLAAIFDRLRNDPSIRPKDSAELLTLAEAALARAQAAAPLWFSVLPRAKCNAVAVDRGSLAYYAPPSIDGQRDGTFFFNTTDPTAWGCQLETTTFHESIPGHHLQLALSLELDIPTVRRDLEFTSFIEGWGLYSERLADEMGLYSSPTQRLGMLEGDSLRAARLVVDTGLHAFGWSRQRAIDFMFEHVPVSRPTVEAEIDRYLSMPAQATSYMMGRLELDRLRAETTARLGARFDIREFHSMVLGGGAMPLGLLAKRLAAWGG